MSPPTDRFKTLSLETMPPTTRYQSRLQQTDGEPVTPSEGYFNEDDNVLTMPSGLTYSLDILDDDTHESVRGAFDEDEPPTMVLESVQDRENYFLFRVSEKVEYDITTGPDGGHFSTPKCRCDSWKDKRPCRHLLWLFDQITSHILEKRAAPFTLTDEGYAGDLAENPYSVISQYHADMLANSFGCDFVDRGNKSDPRRVQDTREILAAINDVPVDEYRPDLFTTPRRGNMVLERGDLEQTIFRMMLNNNRLFRYFASTLEEDDLINDPFHRLRKRADAALAALDEYSRGAVTSLSAQPTTPGNNGPKNVTWCAKHLRLVVEQVAGLIRYPVKRLETWEYQSAARTLIHVLECVANHNRDSLPPHLSSSSTAAAAAPVIPRSERNLFLHLIGDNRRDKFAVAELEDLTPEVLGPWRDTLKEIRDTVSEGGVPGGWLNKLDVVIKMASGSISQRRASAAAAAAGSGAGLKRTGQGGDRRAKRMK